MTHVQRKHHFKCGFVNLLLMISLIGLMKSRCEAQDPDAKGARLPEVRVTNVRRVFHNGEHNAFTDLIRFQGRYFLTFRSCPDGHMVHPTASIIILSSKDLKKWEQVHQFSVPMRDTRDPHFLEFKGQLFVYTGTWYSGETTLPPSEYDLNKHLGYAAWSGDGKQWHSPVMLEGTFGHYIWKAAEYDGKAYLCGRRKHQFDVRPRGEGPEVESAMLVSEDGLVWKTAALFQEQRGDETVFQFQADGSVLAIGRRGSDKAQILRSKPPYQQWQRKELDRYIGGPMLVALGEIVGLWGGDEILIEAPRLHCVGLREMSCTNSQSCRVVEIIPTLLCCHFLPLRRSCRGIQLTRKMPKANPLPPFTWRISKSSIREIAT